MVDGGQVAWGQNNRLGSPSWLLWNKQAAWLNSNNGICALYEQWDAQNVMKTVGKKWEQSTIDHQVKKCITVGLSTFKYV